MEDDALTNAVELATELTIAWLSNPNTRANATDIPEFLRSMHEAVMGLTATSPVADEPAAEEHQPAVTVRKSLASPDHIISLIDGRPYKTLKRHLSGHGLTPDDYRRRYGLKGDYPMVAPTYAKQRSEMAKTIGLGRKAKVAADEDTETRAAPGRRTKAS